MGIDRIGLGFRVEVMAMTRVGVRMELRLVWNLKAIGKI